jgi:iron complex transport system ATP-binding protein
VSAGKKYLEILTTDQLSVGYGEHTLFEHINLTLYTGELVCFMGPNGIGKSTLIRTLTGLQKPLSGGVQILEPTSLPSIAAKTNHLVAIVLTERVTAQNMTVEELVTFGRYPYLDWNIHLEKFDTEMITYAIGQVNITHLRKKRLFELSDGQLQLTMIARALAQDTPLIVLDEPTAHLDLNNRVEIMKLLRHLSHNLNKAILLATHDLDLALQTADRIWLTGNDKNIIDGIPEDLVLNGSFDSIFQFKGFDLRTGKVLHEAYRTKGVRLEGAGYSFLWTKNALERNGFAVDTGSDLLQIEVHQSDSKTYWILQDHGRFETMSDLLKALGVDFAR